jgi:hypothetical protein
VSLDLETAARRAGSMLRSHFAGLPAPPIAEPRRQRPRVIAAGVAAVMMAVATVVLIALVGPWNSHTTGARIQSVRANGWERIPVSGAGFGPHPVINAAANWHSVFFAAGDVFTPDPTYSTPTTAAVWSSPDGRRWTRAQLPKANGYGAEVETLVATHQGILAIGNTSTDIGQRLADNVVWRSTDGHSWQTLARGSKVFGQGAGFIAGAQQTPRGVVAWGSASRAYGPQEPAIWTSPNGAHWTRALAPPSAAIEQGQIESLTPTAQGWLALSRLSDVVRPAAWTSPNLTTWTRLGDHLTIVGTPNPSGLSVGPALAVNNTVIAGQRAATAAVTPGLLRSRDGGATWAPAPGPNGEVDGLVAVGNRLVATGLTASVTGEQGPPAVWTSSDGQTWTQMPDRGALPRGTLSLTAANTSTLVVMGTATDYYRWSIPAAPRPARLDRTYRDRARSFSLRYPATWRPATSNLTPHLGTPGKPWEIISLGTYPLQVGSSRCAQFPVTALEDLGPSDAFLSIQEARTYTATELQSFPSRPHQFALTADQLIPPSSDLFNCLDRPHNFTIWGFQYQQDGRAVIVDAALGPAAPPQRQAELVAVLNTLELGHPK